LQQGADPNTVEEPGEVRRHSLLMLLISCDDLQLFETVLAAGANPNYVSPFGNKDSVLLHALNEAAKDRRAATDLAMIRLLLKHGAHVNYTNGVGESPMLAAIRSGRLHLVMQLSIHGATRQLSDPLWQEAIGEHSQIASWLKESADYCTPLHHLECLSLLDAHAQLLAGANPHGCAKAGSRTPLELARLRPVGATAKLVICSGCLVSGHASSSSWPLCHKHAPGVVKARAAELVRMGYHLARSKLVGSAEALAQVWIAHILPLALSLDAPCWQLACEDSEEPDPLLKAALAIPEGEGGDDHDDDI